MIKEAIAKQGPVDRFFLGIVITLLVFGLMVFVSASFGILAKNEAKFFGVIFNQVFLGLGVGSIALWVFAKIPYVVYRKYSFYIFIVGIILTSLVFVPGLGFKHGGARRWISLGPVSFQPVEYLKLAFVLYFSAWIAWVKPHQEQLKKVIIPFIVLLGLTAAILLRQPDHKSIILIIVASLMMLFVAQIPWKYIVGILLIGIVGFGSLVLVTPYLQERVSTFLDPSYDPTGSSWQLQQSLTAIGSGGMFGRGLGKSIKKFTHLPEPQGDSVFAVIGEELGFIGTIFTVLLYVMFGLRGLTIASRAPDMFSRLLVTGLVILIVAQSFLNIASIVGLFPLTGVPLVFISHGGTAMLFSLISVGIILNVSRYQKRQPLPKINLNK